MKQHPDDAISDRLKWAVKIAREAGDVTLAYFRQPHLKVEQKADDSPVTEADRATEALLRRRIGERFPDDAILGEELGASAGTTPFEWILDPIDGTKSFVHGVPLYTTLVGVRAAEEPAIGVIHAPATAETVYAAGGIGCWYLPAAGAPPQPARVSQVARLGDALLLTSEVATFSSGRSPDALDVFLRLQRAARLVRTWGDGYGYLMVATGRADVMVDPEMDVWDTAALLPVIEEAGGRFSDWQGKRTIHSRDAIGSNGCLAEEVLAITRGR
jgi:histidinol phosphatase-like enzyme (inositol monophosphatase family)